MREAVHFLWPQAYYEDETKDVCENTSADVFDHHLADGQSPVNVDRTPKLNIRQLPTLPLLKSGPGRVSHIETQLSMRQRGRRK